VTLPAPAAASWFPGVTVNAAKIQSNLTDPINAGSWGLLGEANSSTSVTLGTVSVDFASSCSVTFTLPVQRRVLIFVMASFTLGTTTNGGYLVQPAYSVGSTANTASMTKIGSSARQNNMSGVANGIWAVSATTASSVVLAQGTYTAFGACRRLAGGSASDLGGPFEVIVLDCGPS
jgi:hypothetical protein